VGVESSHLLEKEAVMPHDTKEKQRIASNRYYQQNKEKVKAATAKTKRVHRQKWITFKATLSCTHCGAAHPAIIDFHHVIRDKDKQSVNKLIADGRFAAAFEETKKCIPLCANCHRIHHWDEMQERKVARKAKRLKNNPPG
jgi:hypothetical protein